MLSNKNSLDVFLLKPHGDKLFRLQISRNTLLAILFSLAIHGLILLLFKPNTFKQEALLPARELTVSLATPSPKKVITPIDENVQPVLPAEPIKQPATEAKKKPPRVIIQKSSKSAKPPIFKVPDILATDKSDTAKPDIAKLDIAKPVPEKALRNLSLPKQNQPEDKTLEKPTDMMAYVNQKRAVREAAEADAAKQNRDATAREIGPSAEQIRDEKIKRNFENGTNGIFEITSLGSRNASFAFRGWTNDYSNSRKEFFEVEAKVNQDIRLVMIKRMISLIRQHYTGDFNWESQRMGRTIIMSARAEDSAGLEDFMMMEFFGTNYKTQ